MNLLLALIAMLPVVLLGCVLTRLALGRPVGVEAHVGQMGIGYLLGALSVGALLWLAGPVAAEHVVVAWFPAQLVLLVALFLVARRQTTQWTLPPTPRRVGESTLVVVILLALGAVFVAILVQALALPTLTWDAWNSWLAKSEAWHHAGRFLPFVPIDVWLQQPPGPTLTVVGVGYPETLPRLVAAVAQLAGPWRDSSAHLLWPLLWLSLGGALFGLLRQAGAERPWALGGTAFLLTLPLVTAHASLPGYADLWLASTVLVAGALLARQLRDRRPGPLWLALGLLALLPTIKVEGAIYALLLAAAWLLWRLPRPWRGFVLIAGGVVGPLLFATVGLHVPLPGAGWVVLEWGAATVPSLGRIELSWRPVADTVLTSILLLPNWSLLAYLLPLVLAWRWRRLQRPGLAFVGSFLLAAFGFHFVLFFFTAASAWAEDLTSLNRLLLHVVPLTVYGLVLLLTPPPIPRGRFA